MKEGVINILKPAGMTSNDVVYDVRRAFSIKRVGHTGTLDPGACGVLPVCLGKATKLFDYLVDKEKEYIAELAIGTDTDTLDAYGRITGKDTRIVTAEELLKVIPKFVGEQEQVAPMYSAVSVNGERLYKLARKGVEVERTPRRINVKSIELLQSAENRFLMKIRCSKGTYVRTLCHDMAKTLGTCGYVSFLLRSASGAFTLEDSVSLAEVTEAVQEGNAERFITPVDKVLGFMPAVQFENEPHVWKRLINGADIAYSCDTLVRVYYDKLFVGIGECIDGRLHIKTQFCEG